MLKYTAYVVNNHCSQIPKMIGNNISLRLLNYIVNYFLDRSNNYSRYIECAKVKFHVHIVLWFIILCSIFYNVT